MNKLSLQTINNMSYDEMEVECYVRGAENVPNELLVSMLSRTDDIFQASDDTIDDLETDIKNLESQVSLIESEKDDILSDALNISEITERFLDSGKFLVKDMSYDTEKNLTKIEFIAVDNNEVSVIEDMCIICERIELNDDVLTMTVYVDGNEVVEYEIYSQTIPNIKQEILPYVLVSIVKTLSKWSHYE